MTNTIYAVVIARLAHLLIENGIAFDYGRLYDGYQIKGDGWDAVIHSGSYGHADGLLEIMGNIVRDTEDDVEGWLTPLEVLERVKG